MKFTIPTHQRPDAPAAVGAPGPISAGQLLSDAEALSQAISGRITKTQDGVTPEVLVICADRFHFAAALLAVWKAGFIAALPPNGQASTVKSLSQRPGIQLIVVREDGWLFWNWDRPGRGRAHGAKPEPSPLCRGSFRRE